MRFLKRIFCIFLIVILLFFSVNNSYFSPCKMDTVEAMEIIIGETFYITVEMIIELIAAIGITALSAAIIDDIKDWDWEAILNDLHTWCSENISFFDNYDTEGSSALKAWALADEWTVIEGGGGSSPSPDPNKSPSIPLPDSSDSVTIPDSWGDSWTINGLLAVQGIDLASDLFLSETVTHDNVYSDIAKAYVSDKVANFETATPLPGTDPITESLQARYVSIGDINYTGDYEYINDTYYYRAYAPYGKSYYTLSDSSTEKICGVLTISENSVTGVIYYGVSFWYYDGAFKTLKMNVNETYPSYYSSGEDRIIEYSYSFIYGAGVIPSCNFPIFELDNSDDADWKLFLKGETDDSACINKVPSNRKYNYIDTDDEYGWASTADLSPSDLLAANPSLADNLNGNDVSIASLVAAINALKQRLEEENPNTGDTSDPVPYPDVPTYSRIVGDVIDNPDPVPKPNPDPVPGTDPDPGTEADPDKETETSKDYTGLLGQIINLLKSILQAIKDFMSWFIIDFDAVKAHLLLALENIPEFTGLNAFMDIVMDMKDQISDSYDYPVIKMTTPDVLLPFLKSPEIVLIDFEDYAKYFIMVRTFLKFSLYFGFGLWIIRDIKVAFTLN